MIKIFTLLGLILQFLAFWMAAPEILGADWLSKTEEMIRKAINQLPQLILGALGMAMGVMFYHSMSSFFVFIVVIMIIILLLIFYKKSRKAFGRKNLETIG
ncbi:MULTISPECIES: hypothetical protein [Empedobacter]|uniref:hypothetical protein n=1 Tax=Empedobacter TaxID=59734 RepID=UPI0025C225E0|nr:MULTISPECIES: hypothetical protein [unclassified Empedobacter]